ncbi:methyl-accepting chemotaxis protein [Methylomonas methanica]|uniref:Methyl-accepting chemotaxis sensory transducer with Pas/Pac sensor n=1 Tax=Methylomonas methanica (strain DSM 25384 / MC09) TaxID=857087 RepID=G0A6T8_METMM|nr:methyl-accepting chemotaxis protein [Methylomonas methanica]AEG00559.1 methyl-accepting chemotaxis sensory transducer with Pas/Pac sensor [Methylomonas methanica MC09]
MFRSLFSNQKHNNDKLAAIDYAGQVDAINKSQAVVQFNMDGTVITANDLFLRAMGYSLDEIKGKHHSMFVEPGFVASSEYRQFWEKLNRGEYDAGEYKRIGKGGKEVWLQASYNPILGLDGKPFKVVKYATDVSQVKLKNADYQGQINAIDKAQAVIQFNMDGTIITANDLFLRAMDYSLEEIKGKHHSMFAEPGFAASSEYRQFWEKLNRGEFDTGEYKRIGKGGKEVWLQASYNPILDLNGKPVKVVKYATDVSQEKRRNADYQGQIDAIDKSQAVIQFNMDGTIITANDLFLGVMGYSLDEIKGKHHGMFAEPGFAATSEYRQFWEKLNRGEFDTGEYKRVGKGGKEVWLQASYNPIMDLNGKPFKVVKYAADITEQTLTKQTLAQVFTEVGDVMNYVSEGDLNHKIVGDYEGVYLECKNAINNTIDKLDEIFRQVNESAIFINNSSQEIASGNNNLSQRAEQQAANLEQTAASMEELTSTVKTNADNAQQANLVASNARELAEKGGSVVTAAIAAMQEINDSSNKIADIIGVIDEIAFQTNLLALNASVEAARAGEQGRGFSVVATEVRNLAQRSATAAKESKELIQSSVQKVRAGSEFVNQTGTALTEIVSGVKKVGNIVAAIADASVEQSAGIAQVNQAVAQMDEITQQNAALAEEASAASVSMSDLSTNMVELLSFFKLTGVGNHGAAERPTQPSAATVRTNTKPASSRQPTYKSAASDEEWQDF